MIWRFCVAVLFTCSMVLAQSSTSTPAPAFEAASIRPHQGPLRVMRGFSFSGPRLTLQGYNKRFLVLEAFDLKDYQLSWLSKADSTEDVYYDIVAKAEGDGSPTEAQFRQMLRTLLAQRFNLRFHFETMQAAVYALTVGRNGPKFRQSAPTASDAGHFGVNGRNQTIEMPRDSMESLAAQIPNMFMVSRPVVDRTGLKGTYEIKLEATPEFRIESSPSPEDISVFTAVQEQLGLKLEPASASVRKLVVEHIENPSEN